MLDAVRWKLRRFFIRLLHWEYWPMKITYFPLLPYWCWLSIKARSFFFFSAANPSIQYAGFIQERKSNIYKLIPQQFYPQTVFCSANATLHEIELQLQKQNFTFPLIAKPDIGERGVQVKLIHSLDDLKLYSRQSKVDFLLQEFIDYDYEAGIFYYRIPGENQGHISGIVTKDLLAVTGNGQSNIEELLQRNDRSVLQIPTLKSIYGDYLETVLPEGKTQTLVPYGNHCRGAKFVDESFRINNKLSNSIDQICKRIPGFYFGRLDIKFKSWEDLENGKHFSIIELNGAGSEPTHIYDPSHSLFYGWAEICKHWKLLYQISLINSQQLSIPLMSFTQGMEMKKAHELHLALMTQV
ncbi:MAG: D-alanine-D-alanine ligase [Cytophagales bacterium]|jgi:hypothetical protein|nr:D-alanine--D-alanine ligase [Bacteroidota bacterium]WHZ06539.1 MAG: D-alanine-D-alanine ligase [Cytophagales bacterium]